MPLSVVHRGPSCRMRLGAPAGGAVVTVALRRWDGYRRRVVTSVRLAARERGRFLRQDGPKESPEGGAMLENLDIDDSDSPALGPVPPGVSGAEGRDHIKIAHHHLLVLDGGGYTGAYWA